MTGARAWACHSRGPGMKHVILPTVPPALGLGTVLQAGSQGPGGHRVCGLSQEEQGLETRASGAGRPIVSLPCGACQAGFKPWKPKDWPSVAPTAVIFHARLPVPWWGSGNPGWKYDTGTALVPRVEARLTKWGVFAGVSEGQPYDPSGWGSGGDLRPRV